MPISEALTFNISLMNNGNYRVTRSTTARDVSAPIILRRPDLENYFKGSVLVRGTLPDVWKDLDQVGIVEFSVVDLPTPVFDPPHDCR